MTGLPLPPYDRLLKLPSASGDNRQYGTVVEIESTRSCTRSIRVAVPRTAIESEDFWMAPDRLKALPFFFYKFGDPIRSCKATIKPAYHGGYPLKEIVHGVVIEARCDSGLVKVQLLNKVACSPYMSETDILTLHDADIELDPTPSKEIIALAGFGFGAQVFIYDDTLRPSEGPMADPNVQMVGTVISHYGFGEYYEVQLPSPNKFYNGSSARHYPAHCLSANPRRSRFGHCTVL